MGVEIVAAGRAHVRDDGSDRGQRTPAGHEKFKFVLCENESQSDQTVAPADELWAAQNRVRGNGKLQTVGQRHESDAPGGVGTVRLWFGDHVSLWRRQWLPLCSSGRWQKPSRPAKRGRVPGGNCGGYARANTRKRLRGKLGIWSCERWP